MRVQHLGQGIANSRHVRLVEWPLAVPRCEPGRHQQTIAMAQRYVQLSREPKNHVGARPGSARLDETDVAGRDVRRQREID